MKSDLLLIRNQQVAGSILAGGSTKLRSIAKSDYLARPWARLAQGLCSYQSECGDHLWHCRHCVPVHIKCRIRAALMIAGKRIRQLSMERERGPASNAVHMVLGSAAPSQFRQTYQITFSANCICREVVEVAVRIPADVTGASVCENNCEFVAVGGLKFA